MRDRVGALKRRLDRSLRDRAAEERQLEQVEVALGRTRRELLGLEGVRARLETERREIVRRRRESAAAVEELRRSAGLVAKAAFALGGNPIRLALERPDPAQAGRALAYLRYLQRATLSRLAALGEQQRVTIGLADVLERRSSELSRLIDRARETERRLDGQRVERARVLARLNVTIHGDRQSLRRLEEDRQRLGRLLAGLRQVLEGAPLSPPPEPGKRAKPAPAGTDERLPDPSPAAAPRFAEARGALGWPVLGELVHRFGAPHRDGRLAWNGIWIAAPAGTPVRAVSHGRVAFADWFRGFGLLLIVEHGDGFMSLYGHNAALLRDVGEWVSAAQVVAEVGDSGGLERSGLYFEIREHGDPVDPLVWLEDPDRVAARPTSANAPVVRQ